MFSAVSHLFRGGGVRLGGHKFIDQRCQVVRGLGPEVPWNMNGVHSHRFSSVSF